MKYLIAHRALDHHSFKENSIAGALMCLSKDYIAGIEIDVRLTKDNKLVMYHNLLYNLVSVSSIKYKDMTNVDLLANLLSQVKTDKIILLDIKCESHHYHYLLKKLLKLLKKYPLNYYLCSFNYDLTKQLVKMTKYPVGLFITDLINKNKDFSHLSFLALSRNSYPDIPFKMKMVWTINQKKDLAHYSYIITDKPYLLS